MTRRRTDASVSRVGQTSATQRQERLERLLLDTLIHLSRQGRTGYRKDPVRRQKYLLDHIYGTRPSLAGDPGAGDMTGLADANPDLDVDPAEVPAEG